MSLAKLQPGADSRRNWRTINQLIDQYHTAFGRSDEAGAAVAELRRLSRDIIAAGQLAQIQMAGDDTVPTLLVKLARYNGEDLEVYGDDLTIAKPIELQTQPADEPSIYPVYAEDDLIFIFRAASGIEDADPGTYLKWMDLNVDARRWARDLDLCNGKHALFHCSEMMDV